MTDINEARERLEAIAERWLPVRGYEDSYEVSDLGRVRSIERERSNGHGKTYRVRGRLLSPTLNQNGYPKVALRRSQTDRRFFSVHRLVGEAFVPNPEGKPQINHIDHDRANPRATNLEWTTQYENLAYMTAAGRRAAPMKGQPGPRAAVPLDVVRAIRAAYAAGGVSHAGLAKAHGIGKRSVQRIIARETYGYV